jgi:hypothetical protein
VNKRSQIEFKVDDKIGTGSVECGTIFTLFYHSGLILFIEMHSQNRKTEDGEINISDISITHNFCKPGEFLLFIN